MKQLLIKNNINIFKNSNKGFLTVEAAIFLPIFIIGVLTIAYLIKFMAIQESVFHSFTDEAHLISLEAKINPAKIVLFESRLKNRLVDENSDNISSIDMTNYRVLYPAHGMSGMISMDLNYDVNVHLPMPFYDKLPVSESLIFRGFIGKKETAAPLGFEKMENEEESKLVWIFPRAGGKYHSENCTYIKSEPRQMNMSDAVRNRYQACSICDSAQIKNGSMTYCFTLAGHAYHTGACPTVDKYVISIEKEDAVKRGYTPCTKCGGE